MNNPFMNLENQDAEQVAERMLKLIEKYPEDRLRQASDAVRNIPAVQSFNDVQNKLIEYISILAPSTEANKQMMLQMANLIYNHLLEIQKLLDEKEREELEVIIDIIRAMTGVK